MDVLRDGSSRTRDHFRSFVWMRIQLGCWVTYVRFPRGKLVQAVLDKTSTFGWVEFSEVG